MEDYGDLLKEKQRPEEAEARRISSLSSTGSPGALQLMAGGVSLVGHLWTGLAHNRSRASAQMG